MVEAVEVLSLSIALRPASFPKKDGILGMSALWGTDISLMGTPICVAENSISPSNPLDDCADRLTIEWRNVDRIVDAHPLNQSIERTRCQRIEEAP